MSTCGLPLAILMLEQLRKMDELNWKARMDGAHAALDIDSTFDPALRLSMMQDLMRNTMEAALRPIMHEIL